MAEWLRMFVSTTLLYVHKTALKDETATGVKKCVSVLIYITSMLHFSYRPLSSLMKETKLTCKLTKTILQSILSMIDAFINNDIGENTCKQQIQHINIERIRS